MRGLSFFLSGNNTALCKLPANFKGCGYLSALSGKPLQGNTTQRAFLVLESSLADSVLKQEFLGSPPVSALST